MIFGTPKIDNVELEVIAQIDEIRSSLGYSLQMSKQWTGLLRRNLVARAIQGSNSIEGYNATFDEAVAVVEGEEIDRTEETTLALNGYRNAMTYILGFADDKSFVVNEELIRSLHYMMISHNPLKHPGRWRPGPIYVRREPSGEVVYEGPGFESVPGLMHELVADLQQQDNSVPVIVRAAMAHLNLVMIHPFSDGNGRMGRAMQTLVLARDKIVAPSFSSIEEYLGSRNNTEAYYRVLADVGAGTWHPDRDARPWIRFCLLAHLQQAMTVQRRMNEIARLWNELEVFITNERLYDRMIFALYEASIGLKVRSARYSAQAEVSSQVATRDLRILVEKGFLVAKGEKRGRVYISSPRLVEMRDKTREPRAPTPTQLTLFG
jgi:Fic family protein